jgi:hypothetical protein
MGSRIGQFTVEVLRGAESAVASITEGTFSAHVAAAWMYVLVASGTSATALATQLVAVVSGTSGVANIVMAPSTVVSAEWIVTTGNAPYDYDWTLADMTNVAGFVSTATTSAISRTYTTGGSTRRVSSTVSDAAAASVTSAMLVHVGAIVAPNRYDSAVVFESQPYRMTWPI